MLNMLFIKGGCFEEFQHKMCFSCFTPFVVYYIIPCLFISSFDAFGEKLQYE